MARRNIWIKLINNGIAATTIGQSTEKLENLMLVMDYVGDGVDSAATMTVYTSKDTAGTVKAAVGIMPSLTGTRDAGGNIDYATSNTTVAYEIPGRHQFIYIAITSVTDDVIINLWLGGTEEN